jgi:hypothetical protein
MFSKSLAGGYFGYKCKISICVRLEAPPPTNNRQIKLRKGLFLFLVGKEQVKKQ